MQKKINPSAAKLLGLILPLVGSNQGYEVENQWGISLQATRSLAVDLEAAAMARLLPLLYGLDGKEVNLKIIIPSGYVGFIFCSA